jgi:hypothetical protein
MTIDSGRSSNDNDKGKSWPNDETINGFTASGG